jgi:hypothetical protein
MAGGLMKFAYLFQKLLARRSTGKPKKPAPPAQRTPDAGVHPPAQTPLNTAPADTLRQAWQDASNAEQDVARVSRDHLAMLMGSPPRHRMAHLNDPELTPANRNELANSVRSALPVSLRFKFPRWRPTGLVQRLRLACGFKCIVALVALVACAVPGALAWHNTGTRIVGSDVNWIVDWHLPDGTVLHGSWKARMPAVAMRAENGMVVLRQWLNGRGYATTELDEHWLLDHSFTYVVAPTRAMGTTNPAIR